jgi:hypothetical protein
MSCRCCVRRRPTLSMSCSERDVRDFGYSVGYSKGHFTIGSGLWAGALEGIRTPNLLIRSQMLYPLSYERRLKQYMAVGVLTVRVDGACTATAVVERRFLILNGFKRYWSSACSPSMRRPPRGAGPANARAGSRPSPTTSPTPGTGRPSSRCCARMAGSTCWSTTQA